MSYTRDEDLKKLFNEANNAKKLDSALKHLKPVVDSIKKEIAKEDQEFKVLCEQIDVNEKIILENQNNQPFSLVYTD